MEVRVPENENVYLVKYPNSKWISQARILCACSARDDEYKIRASKFDYDGYDDFDKVKSKTGQESTVFRIRRRIRIPNSANYKIFEIGLKYRIRALRISN